ncbi:diguanylate cyclase [Enterovibrio sp. ZSDZ35]|uniref:Diguanylate cyclase n=1 Tax=Enterovibrio qingdaonensis TaxID=2899818 RepID=A0ABT5QH69_9GAMM|nr:diguanylate cyclase [Enterovibrio sp. ZSDZ35]MDD1780326.1 diguanylate cyclase [Enterovibrio sp. ZSDZ35]
MTPQFIKNLPLRIKLILPIWLLMTVFVIGGGMATMHVVSLNLEKGLASRADILASGAASNLTAALAFEDVASAKEQLTALSYDPDLVFAKVTRDSGTEFASFSRLPVDCAPHPSGFLCNTTLLENVSKPIALGSESLGTLNLYFSKTWLIEEKQRFTGYLVMATTALSLFALFFARAIHGFVSQPLSSLHRSMSNMIRLGIMSHTLPVTQHDELGQLTQCFNDMVTSLYERDKQLVATLRQLEEKSVYINRVLDTIDHGIMVVAPGDLVTYFNPAADLELKSLGCLPTDLDQIFADFEPAKILLEISKAIDEHRPVYGVEIHHRASGKLFRVRSTPMASAQHSLVQFEDITSLQMAEQRRKLAELIFDQSQDATLVLSRRLAVEAQNRTCLRTFGAVQYWHELFSQKKGDLKTKELKQLLLKGSYTWTSTLIGASGNILPCRIVARTVTNRNGKVEAFVISIFDLTTKLELKRLNHMAHHDPLTQLANRTHAMTVLTQAHELGQDMHVLFVDLDGFKNVNDQYGHHVGDELLKVVAKRLKGCVSSDDLVARLAGDEFVIGIRGRAKVDHILERLVKKLNEVVMVEGVRPRVSASIGIRYWDRDDTTSLKDVIDQADKAMYEAKAMGKNRYAFSSEGKSTVLS